MVTEIHRHLTAIKRNNFSKPVKIALESNLLNTETTFFDYGCGHGDDIKLLRSLGLESNGWDPVYKPKNELLQSDIVNLGYVLNVIEKNEERREALTKAWKLTNKVLIISCRLTHEIKENTFRNFEDGFITKTGTFQKFYTQNELKEYIESNIRKQPVSIAPGKFFVFRDDVEKQRFEASLYRIKRVTAPRKTLSEKLFQENEELLNQLLEFYFERGREPDNTEILFNSEIRDLFGSIKKAFSVIKRVKDKKELQDIANYRSQDLLVYLALTNFDGRPKISRLPREIQLDIKAFFGTYKKACEVAGNLLFSLGDLRNIRNVSGGLQNCKVTQSAIYLHKESLSYMPPLFRLYEGCARKYIGEIEEANIIKLNMLKPKVSYLSYPDFNRVAHPELMGAIVVSLDERDVKFYDNSENSNRPILHRKELLVPHDYPFRTKFKNLTIKEEKVGLLSQRNIGNKYNWESILVSKGYSIKGHKLFKTNSDEKENEKSRME